MKLLSQSCLNNISGAQAKQLIVTQKESLGNLSASCLQFYKEAAEASQLIKTKEDGKIFEILYVIKGLMACSLKDAMSEEENGPFLTVEYK